MSSLVPWRSQRERLLVECDTFLKGRFTVRCVFWKTVEDGEVVPGEASAQTPSVNRSRTVPCNIVQSPGLAIIVEVNRELQRAFVLNF